MFGPQIAKKKTKIINQKFMTNQENLINIRRVGDNTTIQETPDQIETVGMSTSITTKCRADFRGNKFQVLL